MAEIVEEKSTIDNRGQEVEKLRKEGNRFFGEGDFHSALDKYQAALELASDEQTEERALILSNMSACYIKTTQWELAAEYATKAIDGGVPNDKALERRAHAFSKIPEKYESSIKDYEDLIVRNPSRENNLKARIAEIKKAIGRRDEDLKEEMVDKLKSLGNMCLRPFGLSTDSFAMTPNGQGGYSISLKNDSQNNK